MILEHVARIWRNPDAGIWESRGDPQDFVYSKVMAWVAVDRAIRSSERFGLPGAVREWKDLRDAMHAEICARGFDASQNTFVKAYGSSEIDASLLLLPAVGFLPAEDPRIAGTLAAITTRLCRDGYTYRSEPAASGEASFIVCSFWRVNALLLQHRREEATALFEHLLTRRNDLGWRSSSIRARAS